METITSRHGWATPKVHFACMSLYSSSASCSMLQSATGATSCRQMAQSMLVAALDDPGHLLNSPCTTHPQGARDCWSASACQDHFTATNKSWILLHPNHVCPIPCLIEILHKKREELFTSRLLQAVQEMPHGNTGITP